MELTERIRKILREEYGINSDDELREAIKKQKPVNIGIFVSPCGMEGKLC